MRTAESFTLIASFALVLAACGDTPGKRALTGGAVGAVAGAVVGSAFGHSIGGALGSVPNRCEVIHCALL
jgi:osmotically inducible lipoprotein OsmB